MAEIGTYDEDRRRVGEVGCEKSTVAAFGGGIGGPH